MQSTVDGAFISGRGGEEYTTGPGVQITNHIITIHIDDDTIELDRAGVMYAHIDVPTPPAPIEYVGTRGVTVDNTTHTITATPDNNTIIVNVDNKLVAVGGGDDSFFKLVRGGKMLDYDFTKYTPVDSFAP